MAAGYEDANDANTLRPDPICKLLRDRLPDPGPPWASQPPLSRFENHIPSDLVVDHWTSDGESSSHRDVLLLHDVWATSNRFSECKIT
jgi:hypothetical protein